MDEIILNQCIGFEWDKGNQDKNWKKHNVTHSECEQVFFNDPLLLFEDHKHSSDEKRMYVLGRTDSNKKLFIAFTIRNKLIRVISARSMSQKREIFMKKLKKIPKFKSETAERKFWEKHDSTEYIDWSHAKKASFPNLKPSTQTISLRLPEDLLNKIKILAHKEDVPYQSLMKILLAQGVKNLSF